MPKVNLPKGPQTGKCRLCSLPCTDEGHGWYHDDRSLGTVRGIWPHFASPVRAVA